MTFVFIHIPKTAGTSFRHALEHRAPGEVVYDYGNKGAATPFVYQEIFVKEGPIEPRVAAVVEEVKRRGSFALAGHFPALRYWGAFPPESFLTFVRSPLERVLSHYDNNIAYGNGTQELALFLEREGHNLQSHLLEGVDIDSFGLIGITEYYAASLELIEKTSGLRLAPLRKNRKASLLRWLRRKQAPLRADAAVLDAIREANAEDQKLYDHLAERFRARYKEAFGREPC